MQPYQNRTNTSCVYDAFEAAGLPTTNQMLNGIRTDEVIELLKSHGYTIHLKSAKVSPKGGFFVIRDWKKDFSHLEYHINTEGLQDYDPTSIGAIATKA